MVEAAAIKGNLDGRVNQSRIWWSTPQQKEALEEIGDAVNDRGFCSHIPSVIPIASWV
jgi:hypothetical protein